jgi:hypothetical protein
MVKVDPNYYLQFNGGIILCEYSEKECTKHYLEYNSKRKGVIIDKWTLFDAYPFLEDFDLKYYKEQNEGCGGLLTDAALYYHYINIGSKERYSVVFKELCFSLINTSPFMSIIPYPFNLTVVVYIDATSRHIPQVLQSIIDQSYCNFQLILVADDEIAENKAVSSALKTLADYDNRIVLTNSFTKNMVKGTHVLIHANNHISLPTRFAKMMTELTKVPHINKVKLVSNYITMSHLDNFKNVEVKNHHAIIHAMYATPYKKKKGEGYHEHLLINEFMVSAKVFRELKYDTFMVDFFNQYYGQEFTDIKQAFGFMEDNDAAKYHIFIKEILCIRPST